jgi:hypothetical protein
VFEPFLVEDIVLPAGVDVIEHLPLPILNPEEERRVLGSASGREAPEQTQILLEHINDGVSENIV